MSHESDRSSAGLWIAIAVALVVIVIGGLLLVGAGLFWLRSSAPMPQRAMAERVEAQRAEQAHLEAQAKQLANEMRIENDLAAAASVLTVAMDAEGNLQLDGAAADLEQLRRDLQQKVQDTQVESVLILPVADSKLEDVTQILSLCMEAGIMDIQIRRSP